jgi:hypothetical protein
MQLQGGEFLTVSRLSPVFKVHVAREYCPDLVEPDHGIQVCDSWGPELRYKACSVQCEDGFEFSSQPAIFYSCAADGIWRPRLADAAATVPFRYPHCTRFSLVLFESNVVLQDVERDEAVAYRRRLSGTLNV